MWVFQCVPSSSPNLFCQTVTPTPSIQSISSSTEDEAGSPHQVSPPPPPRAGPSNEAREQHVINLGVKGAPVLQFIVPLGLGKEHAATLQRHGIKTKQDIDDMSKLDLETLQDVLGKVLTDSKVFTTMEWMKLRSEIRKHSHKDS